MALRIDSGVQTSPSGTRHNVIVKLDACNPPDTQFVIWDSSSSEFILQPDNSVDVIGGCVEEVKVGPLGYDTTKFKGVFTSQSDNSCTNISASEDFYFEGIAGGGFDGANTSNFTISSSHTHAINSHVPLRIINSSVEGADVFDNSGYIQTLRYNTESYVNPSAGTLNIITIKAPYDSGAGSVIGAVSKSFTSCEIHHFARITNKIGYQLCTHYIGWWHSNASNIAEGLTTNTVESLREPHDNLIFNPGSVSASFNSDGDLVISLHHYAVGNTIHGFDYKLVGNPTTST